MTKKSKIIFGVSFVLFLIVLSGFVLLALNIPNIGINNEFFNGKRPTDMGDAVWRSEDGKSWFEVKENSECFGELHFNGETVPVCYDFEHFNRMSIYLNDDGQVNVENGELCVKEGTVAFYGICKFHKNRMSVEISGEDDSERIEKIVFRSEQ